MLSLLRRAACALLLCLAAASAGGFTTDRPLADPALEARARALAEEIRCLVCQNQSIADSNADLARDLRQVVRERLSAGDSDGEVKRYLVQRYGDWILLKPPFNPLTLALWAGPALLLLLGGLGVRRWVARRRIPTRAETDLSAEEEARLQRLLSGGDGA